MDCKLWWEAFKSVVFLLNRLPTSVLCLASPYELVFGTPLDYTYLRTFGCAYYPFLRSYNRHKFLRPSRCLFLGYNPVHKGYRYLHSSDRIYVTRSVEFDEKTFPYPSMFPSSCSPPPTLITCPSSPFPFLLLPSSSSSSLSLGSPYLPSSTPPSIASVSSPFLSSSSTSPPLPVALRSLSSLFHFFLLPLFLPRLLHPFPLSLLTPSPSLFTLCKLGPGPEF